MSKNCNDAIMFVEHSSKNMQQIAEENARTLKMRVPNIMQCIIFHIIHERSLFLASIKQFRMLY